MGALPSICLNMIVRNEAHIVHEALDAVAPYISSWVIVDTGSTDGTQDVIRTHMQRLAIPGELHERPWHNFGHNRSEALALAQGNGDYIWVMDADDTIVGTPDFTDLQADVYAMRIGEADEDNFFMYSRFMLFRDGLPIHYVGVVHEYPTWEAPLSSADLGGDYYVECRHLGGREGAQKYERDRDLLLAEVQSNPDDSRSVFYLAQMYFVLGDFEAAHHWYVRRSQMGGLPGEVYYSLFRIAQTLDKLGAPWPEVQDAYLRAWEYSPHRAEPLFFLGRHYRDTERYQLGYAFARLAAEIPLPARDIQVRSDIYAWRAMDDQAVCASWVGKKVEAFGLWRQLLAQSGIPIEDRERISANRDICVGEMVELATPYPESRVDLFRSDPRGDLTITLIAEGELVPIERTLNSLLYCCLDLPLDARFLVFDAGLSAEQRGFLHTRYPFIDIQGVDAAVQSRFWLRLGRGAQFFAPEKLITRLTSALEAEPQLNQVAINYADAAGLTGTTAPDSDVRRTSEAGRYVISSELLCGPALFDTTKPAAGAATLDEVLCIPFVPAYSP